MAKKMTPQYAVEILDDLVAIGSGAKLDVDFYREILEMQKYVVKLLKNKMMSVKK